MKEVQFQILENRSIAADFFQMELSGDTEAFQAPGQFVEIRLPGRFLRRPISVHDYEAGRLSLIYKTVGEGTAQMSQMKEGEMLSLLTGLGNGFDTKKSGDRPLLAGGGAGVAPLYGLAKALLEEGKKPVAILGFNTKKEVFGEEELSALGVPVYVTTVDGSHGIRGFATAPLSDLDFTYFYACGPEPMEKALYKATGKPGEFSLESRMGCGFGACMGCSIETREGYRRICKDGPVFDREVLLW